MNGVPLSLLVGTLQLFEFFFEFEKILAIFDQLPPLAYSGESHSAYRLQRGVITPRVAYSGELTAGLVSVKFVEKTLRIAYNGEL